MMTTKSSSSVVNNNLHSGYDNNWNILDERVTHSQTKIKLDYNQLLPAPTTTANNRLECEIKNTVWNSINKKDIITQTIEHQCKKFDDIMTQESNIKVGTNGVSGQSKIPSIPRPSLHLTKTRSFKQDSTSGQRHLDDTTTVINSSSSTTSSCVPAEIKESKPTAIVQKMNRINHFDPENVKIEIVTSAVDSNTTNFNDTNNRLSKDHPHPASAAKIHNNIHNSSNNQNDNNNKLSDMIKLLPLALTAKPLLCYRCKEIVYTKELLEPRKGVIFHDRCFRCEECGLKLTLKTFVGNQKDHDDPRVYCKNHAPQLEAGKMDHTAKFISSYQQVPKVPTFNGQIRGPDAGKAAKYDSNALCIQMALNAPRPTKRTSHVTPPPDVVKSDTFGLRYF